MQFGKGLFYAVISSATFGLIPFFAIPSIESGMSVNTVVFYRFFISVLAMALVLAVRRTPLRISLSEYAVVWGLSVFYAATSMLLTMSYMYIPSGTATTIHFLYPIFVTLIMILLFRESGNWFIYLASLMAVVGVAFLGYSFGGKGLNAIGLTLALITVCTYGIYIVGVQKSKVHAMDGLKMTFYVMVNCTIIFFINSLVQDGGFSSIPSPRIGIDLVLLALVPTLISDLTLILAIQRVGSTVTAILGCMEPLTAVVMGILFLGEECRWNQGVGISIILIAVILAISGTCLKKNHKPHASAI